MSSNVTGVRSSTPRRTPAPFNNNGNFGAAEGSAAPSAQTAQRWKRYGIKVEPSGRRWEDFDPRFDLIATPNEVNRFGWIVELNPWDPQSTPVKHTAMGRFKHEAATIHVTDDGTVVAYSGDDERFDYMYKFVSTRKILPGPGLGGDGRQHAHPRRGHALRGQAL